MVDSAFVMTVVGTGMGILIGMGALILTLHIHISSQIKAIQEDGKIFRDQWAAESKEFHGRLCIIEEKRNKILLDK